MGARNSWDRIIPSVTGTQVPDTPKGVPNLHGPKSVFLVLPSAHCGYVCTAKKTPRLPRASQLKLTELRL